MCASSPRRLVAIVEHDPALLDSLRFSLEAAGYAVRLFRAADEAMADATLDSADCLIVDDGLPGMGGLRLLRALRGRWAGRPSILLAADPTSRRRREAEAVGAQVLDRLCLGDALTRAVAEALAAANRP